MFETLTGKRQRIDWKKIIWKPKALDITHENLYDEILKMQHKEKLYKYLDCIKEILDDYNFEEVEFDLIKKECYNDHMTKKPFFTEEDNPRKFTTKE